VGKVLVMKQQTLAMAADQTFEQYRKPTRRDEFLKTMEAIVPWVALRAVIEPHYPKAGNGRPPIGLERMLRIHFIQHGFNLADLSCEEALFAQVGADLQSKGFKVNTGTIVDGALIGAPGSTRNADKARDPERHQTRKGQQRYFGMKLHIGVDSQTGLAHSAVVTPANVHDKHSLPDLLHGNEQRVYGDSAYASKKDLIHSAAPNAKDFTNQRTRRNGVVSEVLKARNRNKSKIRARVEHVFGAVKRLWGLGKERCRGLKKNATRAFTVLALANIYLARQRLMAQLRP
jgi:IS5 family transposase